MELEVYFDNQNRNGNSGVHKIKITKLMLLKHLAFSGQGIAPRPYKYTLNYLTNILLDFMLWFDVIMNDNY